MGTGNSNLGREGRCLLPSQHYGSVCFSTGPDNPSAEGLCSEVCFGVRVKIKNPKLQTFAGWLSRVVRWGGGDLYRKRCANSITSLRDPTNLPLPLDNQPARSVVNTVHIYVQSQDHVGYPTPSRKRKGVWSAVTWYHAHSIPMVSRPPKTY